MAMSNEHLGSMPPGLSIGAWGAPAGMIPVPSVSAQTTSMPNQRERLSPRTPVPVVSNVGCGGNAMQQGVPPLPGGFPASAARGPRVEELLVEQNRLLLGLLQAQQAVAPPSSSSCSAKPFVDPKKVLEEVDPELRKLLQEFETETKNLFFCLGHSKGNEREVRQTEPWQLFASPFRSWSETPMAVD